MISNKLHIWVNILPFIIAILIGLIIFLFFRFLPAKLPLFYSLAWGKEQLGSASQFFIIPASLGLIALLNLVISSHLHLTQVFFKKILMTGTLISVLILTVTFIRIVFIFI